MSKTNRGAKYPKLSTPLPPHLHARLHAAAAVLRRPVETLVEEALERHISALDEKTLELIDRAAASLLARSEIESE